MDLFEEKIVRGYEPTKNIGSRVGFERGQIGRAKVNPSELAAYKLYKVLELFPEFTKESRFQIQNYYKDLEGLENLNLKLFATAILFLRKNPEPNAENFKDENIMEYISNFLPTRDISPLEKKRLIVRLKADFLRYLVFINAHTNSKEEQLENIEIEDEIGYGEEYGEEEYDEDYDEYSE